MTISVRTLLRALGIVSVLTCVSSCGGPSSASAPTAPSTTVSLTVTAISPDSGPDQGGTAVTITGTGFASGTAVAIGGVPAVNVRVVSSSSLTATTAARLAGPADVVVSVGETVGRLPAGFTYVSTGGTSTGRVVNAFQLGSGVNSATVVVDGLSTVTTDAGGSFQLAAPIGGTYSLAVTASSYVDRRTKVSIPGAGFSLSLIPRSFDLVTFDQMARSRLGKLARWLSQPNLVIQKNLIDWTDASGGYLVLAETMSEADLACMVTRVRDAVAQMSGGALNIATVSIDSLQAGTRVTQNEKEGAITIWAAKNLDAAGRGGGSMGADMVIRSGRAYFIAGRSNPALPNTYQTQCNATGLLYRHEIGHVLGYQHVTTRASVMGEGPPFYSEITEFDRQAAMIVYQRTPGNESPDTDPSTFSANVLQRHLNWLLP